jgi:glycine hydroxymethyltransferase
MADPTTDIGAATSAAYRFSPAELDEVADVIVTALRATTPAAATAKAKYELDSGVAEACRHRCADLLARHRLYPEIEL